MKRVIDGKIYDTETAALVACWDNGLPGSDFRACSETLYKTRKGSYFLEADGGPLTEYGSSIGRELSGGHQLLVLSNDEALKWMEEREIDGDIVEHEFKDELEEA